MKRLLLGLLMGGIVTGVNAQVKYSQDFENGFGDMILIDVDKKAPNANVSVYKDAWTIRTADGKPAAHYEHNICIQKGKADILSSFAVVEAAEKANTNLCSDY